jgi:hypothetical protein
MENENAEAETIQEEIDEQKVTKIRFSIDETIFTENLERSCIQNGILNNRAFWHGI